MESGARQAVMWRRQRDGSSDLGALLPSLSAFSSPIPHTLLTAPVRPGLGAVEWRPCLADYTAVSRGFSGTWPLGSGSWRVI